MHTSLEYALDRVCHQAYRKQGIVMLRMVRGWAQIVGPTLAAYTLPHAVRFTAAEPPEATLEIALLHSAYAPKCQFEIPTLLDRIAVYFGYRVVHRIRLVHSASHVPMPVVPLPTVATPRTPTMGEDPACIAAIAALYPEDPESAAVFSRLAAHIRPLVLPACDDTL